MRILAAVLLAALAAACGAPSDEASPDGTVLPSAPDEAPTAPSASAVGQGGGDDVAGGEATSVFDLEIGDCFSTTGDTVETVTVVDCAEPHVYEVFAVFDHEAADEEPYPGDDAVLDYADAACRPYFEDYVGADYETSIYWITSVTPSDETWRDGDREIVCTLKLGQEGEMTTGSAEGSGE